MPTLLLGPLVPNLTGKDIFSIFQLFQHDFRYATQEGDANGVVRGQYAYLDPNYQWQQVSCLASWLAEKLVRWLVGYLVR